MGIYKNHKPIEVRALCTCTLLFFGDDGALAQTAQHWRQPGKRSIPPRSYTTPCHRNQEKLDVERNLSLYWTERDSTDIDLKMANTAHNQFLSCAMRALSQVSPEAALYEV